MITLKKPLEFRGPFKFKIEIHVLWASGLRGQRQMALPVKLQRSIGVLEYWSLGRTEVFTKYLLEFPKFYHLVTPERRCIPDFPSLHHSNTPENG